MSSPASSSTKDDESNKNKVNYVRNIDKKKRKLNALELLMQKSSTPSASKAKSKRISSIRSIRSSSKKQAKKTSSHLDFVACPAGCGRHLVNLDHYINQHLDQACPSLLPQNNNSQPAKSKKIKSTTLTSIADSHRNESIYHEDNTTQYSTTVEPASIEVTSSPQSEHDHEGIIEVFEDTSAVNHGKTKTRNPETNDSTETTLQQHIPAVNTCNFGSDNDDNTITSPISSAISGDPAPALQKGSDDDPLYESSSVDHYLPANSEAKPQPPASNTCVAAVLSPPRHDSAKINSNPCNSFTKLGDEITKTTTTKTSLSSPDEITNSEKNNIQNNDASSNYYYAEEIQQDLQMLKDHSASRSSLNVAGDNDCTDDSSDPPKQTTTEDTHQALKPVGECAPNRALTNNISDATFEKVSCQNAEENQQKYEENQMRRSVVSPEQPSLPVERSIALTTQASSNNPYQFTASNSKTKNKLKENKSVDKTKNVFAHMMKQSSKVFSAAANSTSNNDIEKQFTLTYNALTDALSWTLQGRNAPADWEPPLWSTTVQVKDKQQDPPAHIQLTLHFRLHQPTTSNNFTTTTPQQSHRWVQLPSRLSVPVLKSMLQKSVRRRRPLPAVRVAMELMDKSLGELLRRLPIIMLEDSTLHPDLTPLVWMMMAHSKGFFDVDNEQPSPQCRILPDLKLHVLRIIYQIASCPLQDLLVPTENDNDDPNVQEADSANNVNTPCLSDPFPEPKQQTAGISDDKSAGQPTLPSGKREELQMLIWAMLIRAQYGGMACDVNMLKRYAKVWHQRLNAGPAQPPSPHKCWYQLIHNIHSTGKEQALTRLSSTTVQLEKLFVTDVCKEGIDFHCSDLVDKLLKDPQVPTACHEVDPQSLPDQLLKRCIWKFSSGVNLRRPLSVGDGTNDEPKQQHAALKYLWRDIVAPKVTAYQTNYLKTRLR